MFTLQLQSLYFKNWLLARNFSFFILFHGYILRIRLSHITHGWSDVDIDVVNDKYDDNDIFVTSDHLKHLTCLVITSAASPSLCESGPLDTSWRCCSSCSFCGLWSADFKSGSTQTYAVTVTVKHHIHCVSKKQNTKLLPITSRNVNRFSKFFHWQTHW